MVRSTTHGPELKPPLAFVLAAPLSSTLFGVQRFDPLVYVGIVLMLAFVALVATLRPLRRALEARGFSAPNHGIYSYCHIYCMQLSRQIPTAMPTP